MRSPTSLTEILAKRARLLAFAIVMTSAAMCVPAATPGAAADIPESITLKAPQDAAPTEGSWAFRFTPYAWLTALSGSTTTKGRTTDIDASFSDILKDSETIVALMGYFEARNGPVSLFGDLVYQKLGLGSDAVRSRAGALGGALAFELMRAVEMGLKLHA